MPFDCPGPGCRTPRWMSIALFTAACYHFTFAYWASAFPHCCFDWTGIPRPNHPLLWRAAGWTAGLFGVGLLIASRQPLRHWPIVLLAFAKSIVVLALILSSITRGELPPQAMWIAALDDIIWLVPYCVILWATLQNYAGRPPIYEKPLSIPQACQTYFLSSGESLAEASSRQTLAIVFLRHFGCTFTRQIVRHLEDLKTDADRHGARLVLVHMLQQGRETAYLGQRSGVDRVADPLCELYRAFGLGKGGFLELFGPSVWIPTLVALLRGCGMGHLAGDGLQMPGAFLLRDSEIIATQKPRTQAYLPDLPRLFEDLPTPQLPS